MGLPLDLAGKRFGRLIVVKYSYTEVKTRRYHWLCLCDCGKKITVAATLLKNGNTRSCGCYQREIVRSLAITHGLSHTREYDAWLDMKKRCYQRTCQRYKVYGGRGISVCDEWRKNFPAFLKDMGPCPRGKTLDRRNNDGPYSPENCRWATRKEQVRNKQNTRYIIYNGQRTTLAELSERSGVPLDTLYNRVDRHKWPIDKLLVGPNKFRMSHQ